MQKKASQVLWFFGPSRAGKGTLILNILNIKDDMPEKLLKWLRIDDYSLRVSHMGFCKPGARRGLVDEVCDQMKDASNVALLVKGQLQDLDDNRPQQVREKLRELEHRIVFVWCDLDGLRGRWLHDGLAEPKEGLRQGVRNQLDLVRRLEKDFEITCIDATTKEYQIRERLPDG